MSISQEKLDNLRAYPWAWADWPEVDSPDNTNKVKDLGLILRVIFLGKLDEIIEIENMSLGKKSAEYFKVGFAGISLMFSLLDFIGNFYNANKTKRNPNDDLEKLLQNEMSKINPNYSLNCARLKDLRNVVIHSQMVSKGTKLLPGKDVKHLHLKIIGEDLNINLYQFRVDLELLIHEFTNVFNESKYKNAIDVYNELRKNGNLP